MVRVIWLSLEKLRFVVGVGVNVMVFDNDDKVRSKKVEVVVICCGVVWCCCDGNCILY